MSRRRILAVYTEIARSKELELRRSGSSFEHFLQLTAGEHLKRLRIETAYIILVRRIRVGIGEQIAVQPYLGVGAVIGIDPMYRCTLDLAAVGRIAASAFGIVDGEYFDCIAVVIFDAAGAFYKIRPLQTALRAVGIEPFVLGDRSFEEILGLNPQIAREGHLSRPGVRIIWVVFNIELLALPCGIIYYCELHGAQNGHGALSMIVEILTQAVLKERKLDGVRDLGNADPLTEIAD